MIMDDDDNESLSISSMSIDDVIDEPTLQCPPLYITKLILLVIAISGLTATLIVIPGHRALRKRHYIFPYNLVLSDFVCAIVFKCFFAVQVWAITNQKIRKFLNIVSLSTLMVSMLSIVLVAGYQFITIRIDPFGSKNIITTPRMIMTCVATWVISFAICSTVVISDVGNQGIKFTFLLAVSMTTTVITGIAYMFIYRSVAMVTCEGRITRERKEENKRVLRTFGLIFGTTVICWITPWVSWSMLIRSLEIACLYNAGDMMICVNWIANIVIYWWRLKEFRSMFRCCSQRRATCDVQM